MILPDGRRAVMVHRNTPLHHKLVYVQLTPYVTLNIVRAECTFRYIPKEISIKR